MGKGTRATAGHMPMTHYERTKKFVASTSNHHTTSTIDSADYGTTSVRLAGHSQYQLGTCALTTQSLFRPSSSSAAAVSSSDGSNSNSRNTSCSIALCSPSGYIYDETSIIEYLLLQTQQIKQRQDTMRIQNDIMSKNNITNERKRLQQQQSDEFEDSQRVIKKKTNKSDDKTAAIDDLHRVSYWLSSAQPVVATAAIAASAATTSARNSIPSHNSSALAITNGGTNSSDSSKNQIPTNLIVTATTSTDVTANPVADASIEDTLAVQQQQQERPVSPMTGQPLSRRDLWPIQLEWTTTTTSSSSSLQEPPKVKCAISDKIVSSTGAPVVAYWTSKKPYTTAGSTATAARAGVIVMQSVFEKELQLHQTTKTKTKQQHSSSNNNNNNKCPITDQTIHHVRILQRSGSSYAASGQSVLSAQQYKPTIT